MTPMESTTSARPSFGSVSPTVPFVKRRLRRQWSVLAVLMIVTVLMVIIVISTMLPMITHAVHVNASSIEPCFFA